MKYFFNLALCMTFLLFNSASPMDYVLSLFNKSLSPEEAAIAAIKQGLLIEFKDVISKSADITQNIIVITY